MFFIGVVPFGITTSNWVPIFLHLLILIFYYKGFVFFCLYVCVPVSIGGCGGQKRGLVDFSH